ncbi:MAG: hypothetical protein J6C55_00995 [Oscillospiraceae bacterium]|nr:hypothetical protein [Oscillospiraceae bacterium]
MQVKKIKFNKLLSCVFSAAIISNNLLAFAQPKIQDNLYKNVNDEWLSKTVLPADTSFYNDDIALNPFLTTLKSYAKGSINQNSEIGKAVNTYLSLTDYSVRDSLGVIPLQGYFKKIDEIKSLEDFAAVCALLTKSGLNIINIDYNIKNSATNIEFVDFTLDIYYPNNYNSDYEAYLKKLISLVDTDSAPVVTDQVIGLERSLAKYSDKNYYSEIKGAEFKNLISESKNNSFSQVFRSAFVNQLGIKSGVQVALKDDFLCQLQIIKSADISLLKNFLKASILRSCAGLLTKDIEADWIAHKNYSKLSQDTVYTKILQSSIGFCRMYGKGLVENISGTDKNFVQDIFDKVKNQYVKDLNSLSLQSKNKLVKHLESIKISFGVPTDFQCGVAFPQVAKNSLVNNILALNAFNTAVCVAKANSGRAFNYVQDKTYVLANVDPNMAYDSSTHSVVFCPLIFHSSRYNSTLPSNYKWLTMAFTIGHEVGHCIDSNNLPNLAKREGISSKDVELLSKTFDQISNQISTYQINISGMSYKMNPTRVLFEAVADFYGAKTVIALIKNDSRFTLQEFFEAYAKMRRSLETDEKLKSIVEKEFHPVNEYRVNATLSNFEELYKTYNIGDANGMYVNPEKRVK